MISKIGDRKITITPKIPKDNEKLCDKCGGTGWLYIERDDGVKYIEKCPVCDNGIIHICPDCGNETGRGTRCNNKECRQKRDDESELNMFEKATKYTIETAPKESCEYFYYEGYGYDNGYFDDLDSLEDYCNDNDIEIPKYIWGTTIKTLSMNAIDIVSNELEEWYEDAFDRVGDDALSNLQVAMDVFCKECGVGNCYEVDYKTCIVLK